MFVLPGASRSAEVVGRKPPAPSRLGRGVIFDHKTFPPSCRRPRELRFFRRVYEERKNGMNVRAPDPERLVQAGQ